MKSTAPAPYALDEIKTVHGMIEHDVDNHEIRHGLIQHSKRTWTVWSYSHGVPRTQDPTDVTAQFVVVLSSSSLMSRGRIRLISYARILRYTMFSDLGDT